MINLNGKIALVTGAGRGIGKGCASQLARCGADILLNDRPGSRDLASTADEIRALGRTCHAFEADVFSRSGCEGLVKKAIDAAGRIDIFISNPAYSRRGKFLEYPPEEFERTINGTLTSGFHMSQLVARHIVGGDGVLSPFVRPRHAKGGEQTRLAKLNQGRGPLEGVLQQDNDINAGADQGYKQRVQSVPLNRH